MKYDTDKGFCLIALLLIFAIADNWGIFWKVAVSLAAVAELIAVGNELIDSNK